MQCIKRKFRIPVVAIGLFCGFVAIQTQHPMWFRKFRWDAKVSRTCTPPDVVHDMLDLTHDIHMILKDLEIKHFLLYGSLWGALRIKQPLPWDDDVDLGMVVSGKFSSLSVKDFLQIFKDKGIHVTDNFNQKSSFKFKRNKGAVDLMVYYEYGEWMKRRGWETWMLALLYSLHHTFPKKFIQGTLPERQFGSFKVPVPKGGIEIMKHMYRYDWWVEHKGEEC